MDSVYEIFFNLLKILGVESPSHDLLFPFAIVLGFGFLSGSFSTFIIFQILKLEKDNKKEIFDKTDLKEKITSEKNIKASNINNKELKEKIKSRKNIDDSDKEINDSNEEESEEVEKEEENNNNDNKKENNNNNIKEKEIEQTNDLNKNANESNIKKEGEDIIKPEPNFKRPDIDFNKKVEEEGEWKLVGKKRKKRKID